MVATQNRPVVKETKKRPPRRGRWLGAGLLALAILAAALAIALVGNDGGDETAADVTSSTASTVVIPEPGSPEAVMQEMIVALQALDGDRFAELEAPLDTWGRGFLEWNLALGMEPVFSDCNAIVGSTATSVTCDVAMGDEYFFSRVEGETVATTVQVSVSNGRLAVASWPPPAGLVATENALREWIRVAHPEDESSMFGSDYAGVIDFSKEAGELHMKHLEGYLASFTSPAASSPEAVMEALATTVESLELDGLTNLDVALDSTGRRFLEWNLALGMEPSFSNCAGTAGTTSVRVTCDVAMGEGYFFSRVEGENVATTVQVSVSNGRLSVASWPPPAGLVATENALREWIRVEHPEDESSMFGSDYAGVIDFSKEAGELHMKHLDEYLASLAAG